MQEENAKIVFLDFPVSDIVSETAQSFLSLAKTQNKDIHVEIEPMLSLCGDEKAVRQLVCILLDNALKYSNAGGYICVYLKKRGKNILLSVANSTAFEVRNENINSIFERFYRLDPSHSSEISGQGIGLSIAKAIMDTHKGKIFAYTVDGRSICITAVFLKQ
jgi:signal transduction histidine kinase